MAKGKRIRGRRKKTVSALEAELAQLSALRQSHADCVKKLDIKIAAQEGLIEVEREEEAYNEAMAHEEGDG